MQYDVNQVIGRLASKIANLEMDLAHSQALNQAYEVELQKLKHKLKEIDEDNLTRQVEENLKAE